MGLYFSKSENAFYDSLITNNIPNDCVEITPEKHKELLYAINYDCIVFDDLTHSTPKPSLFHYWNSKTQEWDLNKEKKLKNDIIFNKNTVIAMMYEAKEQISLLQDSIDEGIALDGDEDKLQSWRRYRVLLSQVDTNVEEMELPEKPF